MKIFMFIAGLVIILISISICGYNPEIKSSNTSEASSESFYSDSASSKTTTEEYVVFKYNLNKRIEKYSESKVIKVVYENGDIKIWIIPWAKDLSPESAIIDTALTISRTVGAHGFSYFENFILYNEKGQGKKMSKKYFDSYTNGKITDAKFVSHIEAVTE